MRKLYLLILLVSLHFTAKAQQQATFAQYMFNGIAINPAYAGSHDALSASQLTRFQNVGLPGAPNTQTFSVHSPLTNQRVALGLLVVHDKISVISQTGVNAMYAYRLPMPNGGMLSMGLQAGFTSYKAMYSQLDLYQQNDVAFNGNQDVRQTRPNFGAGVYYHTKLLYVGLSMPHMANNVFSRNVDFKTIHQSVPVIVSGGYVFILSKMVKMKPNFLFKWVDHRAVELDLNTNFLFDDVLWLGVSYKFTNAATLITEMQLTDQLRFGYSYSVTTGPIRKAELGSHEILLNYRFKYFSKGIVTPRYF